MDVVKGYLVKDSDGTTTFISDEEISSNQGVGISSIEKRLIQNWFSLTQKHIQVEKKPFPLLKTFFTSGMTVLALSIFTMLIHDHGWLYGIMSSALIIVVSCLIYWLFSYLTTID
ncbi:hypothetical protein ACFVS2_25940 [Brevibacillus sp. NPDC058079]|uniref:hypothetical protein n=1 Tax=Brevibacillus sp. NPDC058079 TaxID=3346330 RepID=UPI0036EA0D0D